MKRGSYLWKMQDQNQRKSGKSFWVILDGEEAEWIERDPEKWVRNCAERLNRNLRFKNVPFSYRRAIEDLTRGVHSKDSQWIEVAIEKLSRGQKVSWWIEVAIESYRECDKKQLKGLDK